MLIDYDHSRNITEEQRLASLKRSVQMALDSIHNIIGANQENKADTSVPTLEFDEKAIRDACYPVGSVIMNAYNSFNPNVSPDWPGTWRKAEDEQDINTWTRIM